MLEYHDPRACSLGVACRHPHSHDEMKFHPGRYKRNRCTEPDCPHTKQPKFCWKAHTEREVREGDRYYRQYRLALNNQAAAAAAAAAKESSSSASSSAPASSGRSVAPPKPKAQNTVAEPVVTQQQTRVQSQQRSSSDLGPPGVGRRPSNVGNAYFPDPSPAFPAPQSANFAYPFAQNSPQTGNNLNHFQAPLPPIEQPQSSLASLWGTDVWSNSGDISIPAVGSVEDLSRLMGDNLSVAISSSGESPSASETTEAYFAGLTASSTMQQLPSQNTHSNSNNTALDVSATDDEFDPTEAEKASQDGGMDASSSSSSSSSSSVRVVAPRIDSASISVAWVNTRTLREAAMDCASGDSETARRILSSMCLPLYLASVASPRGPMSCHANPQLGSSWAVGRSTLENIEVEGLDGGCIGLPPSLTAISRRVATLRAVFFDGNTESIASSSGGVASSAVRCVALEAHREIIVRCFDRAMCDLPPMRGRHAGAHTSVLVPAGQTIYLVGPLYHIVVSREVVLRVVNTSERAEGERLTARKQLAMEAHAATLAALE
jgi:hypothetical protein